MPVAVVQRQWEEFFKVFTRDHRLPSALVGVNALAEEFVAQ